ncbi:MAG: hypothetical protein SNJ63_09250 [Sphingomonadaceae bacterium]
MPDRRHLLKPGATAAADPAGTSVFSSATAAGAACCLRVPAAARESGRRAARHKAVLG